MNALATRTRALVVATPLLVGACVTPYARAPLTERADGYDGGVRAAVHTLDTAVNACVATEARAADAYEERARVVAWWQGSTAVVAAVVGGTGGVLALLGASDAAKGDGTLTAVGGVLVGAAPLLSTASTQVLDAVGLPAAKAEELARATAVRARIDVAHKELAALDDVLRGEPSPARDDAERAVGALAARVRGACGATAAPP